jgi:hypothetical protein
MTIPAGSGRARIRRWRTVAVCALLAAGTIWWAAMPLHGGRPGTRITLITAIAAALLGVAQVASVRPRQHDLPTGWHRAADLLAALVWAVPWPEVLLVAVLVLEALHPARPWHTGVLGVAIVAFLLAANLAETGAQPSVLRAQLPVLAAGLGLLALAVGAAALPALSPGPAATAARVAAVLAAVIAGALAVPVGGSRRRPLPARRVSLHAAGVGTGIQKATRP